MILARHSLMPRAGRNEPRSSNTNRKSSPHAVELCCVERFEEPIGSIGSKPDPVVLHGWPDVFVPVAFRLDQQLYRPFAMNALRSTVWFRQSSPPAISSLSALTTQSGQ